jgi:hypothetical protein
MAITNDYERQPVPRPLKLNKEQLKAKTLAVADDVFARYIMGESFETIASTLKFPITGSQLRVLLKTMPETADTFSTLREERAHRLFDLSVEMSLQAGNTGDLAGLKIAIDTNLKIASKLNAGHYGDKSSVELTGKDGGAIKIHQMTDEQLLEIASQGLKNA